MPPADEGPSLAIGPPAAPEVEPDAAGVDDAAYDEGLADEHAAPVPVDEALVRAALVAVTETLAITVGDEDVPDHWRMTPDELDALVPPLARMAARRPKVAAALEQLDPLTAGLVMLGYTARNIADGKAARAARGDDDGDREPEAGAAPWGADPADPRSAADPGPTGWPAGGDAPRGYGFPAPEGGGEA